MRLRIGQLAPLLHEVGQGLDLRAVDAHPRARLQEHFGLTGGHGRHEWRQWNLLLTHVDVHAQGEPVGAVLVVTDAGGDDRGLGSLAVVRDVVVDLDIEGLQLAQDRQRLGHEAGRGHTAQVQGVPDGGVLDGQGQQAVEDLAGQAGLPLHVSAGGPVLDAALGSLCEVPDAVAVPDLAVLGDVADEPLGGQVVLIGVDVDRERSAQRRGPGQADGGVGGQDRQRPGEGLEVLGLEALDVSGRDGDRLPLTQEQPRERLGGARLDRHEQQLASGHPRVEAVNRVADRHERQIELDPGYLLAVDLLDVVDLQRGGDDDASVALPDEVDAAAQALGEVDGPAVALRGGEGQAGRHPAPQHLPDVGGRGHQGDAVVGVVEAVAASHTGQLAQDADHLGVHLVVEPTGGDLAPGGALSVPAALALDERQHGWAGRVAPHAAGVIDDLQGHPTARRALQPQQAGQTALPGGDLPGRGCDVGLLLRQGTRRDEQGGHVLAVGAHRARAVASPCLRTPLVVLLAEDHGLIDVGARALGLGTDDVPVSGDADAPHPALARVVQAAPEGPTADPSDDLVISEPHRPVVMPNSARHDPRLDAGYDAFGHHEHRSNAQRERSRLYDVRDEGSTRVPRPLPGAGREDKDLPLKEDPPRIRISHLRGITNRSRRVVLDP